MADSYLVVRMVDVTGAPVGTASVSASFDGGSDVALTKVTEGIVEVMIPAGTAKIKVVVTPPSPLWPAIQDVAVDTSPSPPSLGLDGVQQFNTGILRVVSRGADFNLEVHFVLGQLLDVTDNTKSIAAGFGVSYDTPPGGVRRSATPILNPAGSGGSLLNLSMSNVTYRGKVFFAARQNTPQLIVLGHPGWNPPRNPQQARLPIPFHLFFHPTIPADWAGYPNAFPYLDLPWRYLINLKIEEFGKGMLYQNNADTLKNVFVFPVGSRGEQMGGLLSQGAVVRLLQEAAFFLQRLQGVAIPLQPLGSISLSCFSAGANSLGAVLMGAQSGAFQRALRNVFVFDGVIANNASAPTKAFASFLGRWIRSGRAGRSLRVYTQNAEWFDSIQAQVNAPVVATGPSGAREAESDSCTVLHTPTAFWKLAAPGSSFGWVHQIIPAIFMEHAVTNSTFDG